MDILINQKKKELNNFLRLIRAHHYIKNLFIFMPVFFAGKINNLDLLLNAIIAFIAFSTIASAVYVLNDFKDVKADLQHPRKKFRPLASGEISKKNAILIMILLLALGISLSALLSLKALTIVIIYILLNTAYSYYLKHLVILDLNCIALGFVLRIVLGSVVTGTLLSIWIIIMTYLIALFLALAKRRDDILLFLESGKKMRNVIDGYNIKYVDIAMIVISTVVVVVYILYTVSNEVQLRIQNEYLYSTVLFVMLGLMRYIQLSFVTGNTSSPVAVILKDKFIQLTILLWILTFTFIIYL